MFPVEKKPLSYTSYALLSLIPCFFYSVDIQNTAFLVSFLVLTPILDVYSVENLLLKYAIIHKYNLKIIYFSLNFNIHFVPLLML